MKKLVAPAIAALVAAAAVAAPAAAQAGPRKATTTTTSTITFGSSTLHTDNTASADVVLKLRRA